MTVPTGHTWPGGVRIFNVPEAGASTSCTALSFSSENSGCPCTTAPPSGTSHSAILPSVMEKPNFGRMISVLKGSHSGQSFTDRGLNLGGAVEKGGFQHFGERHGAVLGGDALHRRFELPPQAFVNSRGQLRTDSARAHGFVHDHRPTGLGDRAENGVHIRR